MSTMAVWMAHNPTTLRFLEYINVCIKNGSFIGNQSLMRRELFANVSMIYGINGAAGDVCERKVNFRPRGVHKLRIQARGRGFCQMSMVNTT